MSDKLPVNSLWTLVPRSVLGFEAALLIVLFLLFRARGSLGIQVHGAGTTQILMVGLFLIVANHIARLVHSLAKHAGAVGARETTWPFFVLPLILYLVILPWSTTRRGLDGDEPHYLLITHSLAYDLDVELTNNYEQQDSLRFLDRALEPSWADPVRADGRKLSRHSPGLPLLLAPGYRLAGKWGALATMAFLTALASWLAYRLARRYWPEYEREVVWSWALLSLTPPLLFYSHQIWVEVPAMVLLLIALDQIYSLQEGSSRSRRCWSILTGVIILLPVLKLRLILFTGPLLILAWWRSGRSRRALVGGGLGLALLAGGLLTINRLTTGRWLRDHSLEQIVEIQGRHPLEYLRGAAGLFWDCALGLFAANPVWLLCIPALLLVFWQRKPIALDLALLGIPYLAVIAPRAEWYGAWSPPFRFGMVLLPLLSVALVPLLANSERLGARIVTTLSVVLGGMLAVLWLAEPGWTYNLATGTNHLLDHLASVWSADAARFFPSLVRPRTASWLVPMAVGSAAIVLWWWPRQRPGQTVAVVAMLLLALAALPLAAHRVPTGVIEMEDRQVTKRGGELYPEAWVPYRPRFRGGWRLSAGDAVSAPAVTGGERVSVDVELKVLTRTDTPPTLSLLSGDAVVATAEIGTERSWQTLSFENLEWKRDARLGLVLNSGEDNTGDLSVVVDRATLRWR